MLGMFDVAGAALALFVILALTGNSTAALCALAGVPLLVVLLKIAGLYDRDELRLVHSTLDEVPVLLELTGLFALCVTILHSVVAHGRAQRTRDRRALARHVRSDPRRAHRRTIARRPARAERALPPDRGSKSSPSAFVSGWGRARLAPRSSRPSR